MAISSPRSLGVQTNNVVPETVAGTRIEILIAAANPEDVEDIVDTFDSIFDAGDETSGDYKALQHDHFIALAGMVADQSKVKSVVTRMTQPFEVRPLESVAATAFDLIPRGPGEAVAVTNAQLLRTGTVSIPTVCTVSKTGETATAVCKAGVSLSALSSTTATTKCEVATGFLDIVSFRWAHAESPVMWLPVDLPPASMDNHELMLLAVRVRYHGAPAILNSAPLTLEAKGLSGDWFAVNDASSDVLRVDLGSLTEVGGGPIVAGVLATARFVCSNGGHTKVAGIIVTQDPATSIAINVASGQETEFWIGVQANVAGTYQFRVQPSTAGAYLGISFVSGSWTGNIIDES